MSSASFSLLAFSAAAIVASRLSKNTIGRRSVLLAASAIFLWLCSEGANLGPLLGFVALGFAGLKIVETLGGRVLGPVVTITILIFVWLKKYTFLPGAVFLKFPYSTLGLSYILFRIVSLMVDTGSGTMERKTGAAPYLTHILNFTTLVAGPIQSYEDFDRSLSEWRKLSAAAAGAAVQRIVIGFFKVDVLGLALSTIKGDAVAQMTSADGASRTLAAAIAIGIYPLFLYCNFSGYIDIVIGVAKLIGLDLPENFDRPFSADNFLAFWSRWHITLSEWLKKYVYNPLLITLIRRFPARSLGAVWAVAAYFVTFFLVGAWHGQSWAFLFFGVLQGLGVSVNKLYQMVLTERLGRKGVKELAENAGYVIVCRGLTFTWFAFTLLWFWSYWAQIGTFEKALGPVDALAALGLIFVIAAISLAAWEKVHEALFENEGTIWRSRYVRTAYCTVLVLISILANLVVGQQVPEIVYKAF